MRSHLRDTVMLPEDLSVEHRSIQNRNGTMGLHLGSPVAILSLRQRESRMRSQIVGHTLKHTERHPNCVSKPLNIKKLFEH